MSPHTTTITGHEWLSIVFLVPFAVHLLLHWQWILQTASPFVTDVSQANQWHFILDEALYLTMTSAIISGFLASEALFNQVGINFTPDPFWTQVHHPLSNLLLPILGVNLALQWGRIVKLTKRILAMEMTDECSQTEPDNQAYRH